MSTTTQTRSILSYLVTMNFKTCHEATFAGMHMAGCTGQPDAAFKVSRVSGRRWLVAGFIKDVDLDGERGPEIRHLFGEAVSHGLETFSTEG